MMPAVAKICNLPATPVLANLRVAQNRPLLRHAACLPDFRTATGARPARPAGDAAFADGGTVRLVDNTGSYCKTGSCVFADRKARRKCLEGSLNFGGRRLMDRNQHRPPKWRRVIGCALAALVAQGALAEDASWPAVTVLEMPTGVLPDDLLTQLGGPAPLVSPGPRPQPDGSVLYSTFLSAAPNDLLAQPGGPAPLLAQRPLDPAMQTAFDQPMLPPSTPFPLLSEQPSASPEGLIQLAYQQPNAPSNQTPPPADQQYGEKPQDRTQEFLRQDSVLLKEGQWQFDVGFSYLTFDHNFTQLLVQTSGGNVVAVSPLDSRQTVRLMTTPLGVRYGITDRLQAFAIVPFGWSNTEVSYPGSESFVNEGGIGDVSAGVSWLVRKSCGCPYDPDIIATFGVTAPTANVNPLQGILEPPNTLLGTGFWYGYWNVTFVHTIDPIVLFYGFGSRHGLNREYDGFDIAPGAQYYYRVGMGFAVNERITLSSALIGNYVTDPSLNGVQVPGLAMEPITLRFAATIARPCDRLVEPFVEFGLTPDAPNARVGVTFTY
jgi:hypothetical protein